jgi:hypothetical protein
MDDGRVEFDHTKAPRKRRHRATKPRLLNPHALDQRSTAARMFGRLVADIESDLGGRDHLSAIEHALVEAYAGAALVLDNLNARLLRGEPIDIGAYAQITSSMVRVATRLGIRRRARDVTVIDPLEYARDCSP